MAAFAGVSDKGGTSDILAFEAKSHINRTDLQIATVEKC
jgi:hypothetical protein